MTEQPTPTWQPPEQPPGPAAGLEFGDFGARLVAYIVDALIIAGLVIAVLVVPVIVSAAGGTFVVALSAVLVVTLGYFPWFWARSGSTPGMRLFGLRVVRDADGGKISGGQAILRLIGFWVSSAVFYLGFIWIFIDKRRRGWHDLIAGTVVVRAR